ncbi:MAG: hypothetical protein IKU00_05290 [Bacteroidales bacterium]|nr:hypothetical protein [Bacteroidales bacterium]
MKLCNIYCEGKKGSHDFDILEKTLGDLRPYIIIKPIGGKRGSRAIMNYVETSGLSAEKADDYLMFRDRDFDKPVPSQEQLIQDNHLFFSYRTTIENYLLDSQLIFDYDHKKGTNRFSSVDEVVNLLCEAASCIKEYQAVRHALGVLHDGASFGTRWTNSDGILPSQLGLDDCINAAYHNLIFNAKAKTDTWTLDNLKQEVNKFLDIFNEEFFCQQKYLVWFQGKDLAKSFCLKSNSFPMESYYKFAKSHFDFKKFADLIELRRIVESKIQ